jgi:hypothetical protein
MAPLILQKGLCFLRKMKKNLTVGEKDFIKTADLFLRGVIWSPAFNRPWLQCHHFS